MAAKTRANARNDNGNGSTDTAILAPLPSEALQNALTRITQDSAEVQRLNHDADKEQSGRGYTEALAASQRMGLDWQAFSNWVPAKTGAKDPGEGEKAIRALHAIANPATSPAAELRLKELMQLVVDASSPNVAADANARTRMVLSRTPNAVRNTARAKLEELRDTARKVNADKDAALYDKHVNAIDNRDAMLALANERSALSTKAKRFRARLTLHLISDLLEDYAGPKVGSVYQAVADHALSTLRTFQQNSDGQERTPAKLEAEVRSEVTRKLGETFKLLDKAAVPAEVTRANLYARLFGSLAKLCETVKIGDNWVANPLGPDGLIPETTVDEIKKALAKKGLRDPEQVKIEAANATLKASQPKPVTTGGKRKVNSAPPSAPPTKAAKPTTPAAPAKAKPPLPAPPPSARRASVALAGK